MLGPWCPAPSRANKYDEGSGGKQQVKVAKSVGCRGHTACEESWLCYLLTGGPRANHLISSCLSFFLCKMGSCNANFLDGRTIT